MFTIARCEVCGESYETAEQYAQHVERAALDDRRDGCADESLDHNRLVGSRERAPELASCDISNHLADCSLEVLVFVEAVESATSSTVQARHSYSFAQGEILFDRKHREPCTRRDSDGACVVDLDEFHGLERASEPGHAAVVRDSLSLATGPGSPHAV